MLSEESLETPMSVLKSRFRGVKIVPSLLKPPPNIGRLLCVAVVTWMFTVVVVDSALRNEVAGISAVRPLDIFFLRSALAFLILCAIMLYPILALHYRQGILLDEEVKKLNMKYQEGLQEFLSRASRHKIEETTDQKMIESIYSDMLGEMSSLYPDFVYLHKTLLERMWYGKEPGSVREGRQTYEQWKKEYLRSLITATAQEVLEDTAYSFSSYEMPVTLCMLAVAFGFIVSSLVLFLGTDRILFGNASVNLVWAAGGFIGAYLYSLYPFFQRYSRRDLPPRAFFHYAMKVFLGIGAVTIFGDLFLDTFAEGYQFPVAAVLGSMPFLVMAKAREYVLGTKEWFLGKIGRISGVGDRDVAIITGITHDYAERLHEEGVMNVQNLAFIDVETLSKRTMFSQNVLFDWKDEAILRLLAGNIVRKKEGEGESKEETLYEALMKIGVSNVSTLATRLDTPDATTLLVNLLGWDNSKELRHSIERICVQGTEMLGAITKPSITAFTLA